MKIVEFILLVFILFLIGITTYYWGEQKRLLEKKRKKKKPKFELIEVSGDDDQYNEYYEPKIVEVVSSDEYL